MKWVNVERRQIVEDLWGTFSFYYLIKASNYFIKERWNSHLSYRIGDGDVATQPMLHITRCRRGIILWSPEAAVLPATRDLESDRSLSPNLSIVHQLHQEVPPAHEEMVSISQ